MKIQRDTAFVCKVLDSLCVSKKETMAERKTRDDEENSETKNRRRKDKNREMKKM